MRVNGSRPEHLAVSGAGPEPAVWREGARIVVALRGEQDVSTAPRVVEALAGAGTVGDGAVAVDLSGVTFMDAAIVTALVAGRDELRSQSRAMTVRAPSRIACRILGMCDLMELIEPVPAHAAGAIGSCVTVRGKWSRAEQGSRAVKAPPLSVPSAVAPAVPDAPIRSAVRGG